MAWLYREGKLGEGQPSPWVEEVWGRGAGFARPKDPVTGRDLGMLGEPSGQICSDMLHRSPQLAIFSGF